MKNLNQTLLTELRKLEKKSYVRQDVYHNFISFIASTPYYVKKTNCGHHVCCFFLPIHKKSKSVYFVHHKKADDWIPPGGHMEPEESPIQTVNREFFEELHHRLSLEPVELLDISIKPINSPVHPCKTHYDLWYGVFFQEKKRFVYLQHEFYDARWMTIQQAKKRMKDRHFAPVLNELANRL